ncbi:MULTISPECIES: TetR/AcrR family transcriptional regulator [Nocardiopsis]|jgi:AcrR family transcriptional regulator|uniref:AcrR family transcriptional regulator n=1 Tax=Nocardiopsis sinuspersici TaxID=501010 RepID=A0A1V3C379_9ACTN|nr:MULTISPECIES: TetR family transcriptional regulator [Nocardiopsis]NYH51632.1 AcrR family transcriptional regulator [Nocardiopsis sinuspersici]OOC55247.1 TetR family transcriptional regulator [Nocardiopsis sinuspersici]
MSSAKRSDSESDLTARARIRDAAIECFGQHGFDVTVRAIAEQAGVSPGLVIHHFGSKDGLRRACDDHVLGLINDLKKETITSHDSQTLLHQLASMEEYAPYVAYLFRSVQTGGGFAVSFYERMVTDIERYLAAGEAEGTVRPSRDPAKRARYLAANAVGAMLLRVTLHPPGQKADFARLLREWSEEYALPALELYTEGLLTERTMLDAYLLYVSDPPEESG